MIVPESWAGTEDEAQVQAQFASQWAKPGGSYIQKTHRPDPWRAIEREIVFPLYFVQSWMIFSTQPTLIVLVCERAKPLWMSC